jgi:hypothetical protein
MSVTRKIGHVQLPFRLCSATSRTYTATTRFRHCAWQWRLHKICSTGSGSRVEFFPMKAMAKVMDRFPWKHMPSERHGAHEQARD